jgi:membrane protein DedA with SNARE-associated domain
MFEFVQTALDRLEDLAASPWFYLVILGMVAFDSVVPLLPSETLVIAGGVSAGLGDLDLALVILVAAIGAFLGDHLSYAFGRRASGWMERRAARREKTANRLRWASSQIRTRGGLLLVTARFIPAGRTVLTLSAGVTKQPVRWFATWVTIAVTIWAIYAASLGFVFGATIKDNDTLAFLAAFSAALGVTAVTELFRWWRNQRLRRRLESHRAHS